MIDVGKHCKDCKERYIGCHGKCEKYLGLVRQKNKETLEAMERARADRQMDSYFKEDKERRRRV